MNGKHQYQKKRTDIVHAVSFGLKFWYGNTHVLMAKTERPNPFHISVALAGNTLTKVKRYAIKYYT
jgi:hypothetical protein